MAGNYALSSTLQPNILEYEWTKPPGSADDRGDCGECTDCTVNKGIKDMELTSVSGAGFSSFELSQLYANPRCGRSCFDLDGSYWTGMTYKCTLVSSACLPACLCPRCSSDSIAIAMGL